ncbi:MAG: hypothetical protein PVH91_13540, partial [Pseudomonadales bacterium]
VADAFRLGGTVKFRQLPGGEVEITIDDASLSVGDDPESIDHDGIDPTFEVGGRAAFKIGGAEGFRMQDFRLDGVTLDGHELSLDGLPELFNRPLVANVMNAFDGGVIDVDQLNADGFLDVEFPDVNDLGITGINNDEFTIHWFDPATGQSGSIATLAPIQIGDSAWRYVLADAIPSDVQVSVEFLADGWTDGTNSNTAEREYFFATVPDVVSGAGLRGPPIARLTNPTDGSIVDPGSLKSRGFIDVTFESRSGEAIDPNSIDATDITLAALAGSTGIDVQIDTTRDPRLLYGSTYRFFLADGGADAGIDLFADDATGSIEVTFIGGGFAAGTGAQAITNIAQTELIAIDGAKSGKVATNTTFGLGPLVLEGPSIGIEDIGFADGKVIITIAVGLDRATLSFGSGSDAAQDGPTANGGSGIVTELTGILATFDLGVGLPGDFSLAPTGKFSFTVESLLAEIPEVVRAEATGIAVNYDPAADASQEILRVDSADLTFEMIEGLDVTGSLDDLVITGNSLSLGQGSVTGSGGFDIGGVLTVDSVTVGLTDLVVDFSQPGKAFGDFNGSVYIASGDATLAVSSLTATVSDGPDEGTDAFRIELDFESGHVQALVADIDRFALDFGGVLTVTANDFELNTGAADQEFLVFFGAVGAELGIGSVRIGGEARNFGILGNGTLGFDDEAPFAVILDVDATSGSALGWPEWLPIRINTLGVEFANIIDDPTDLTLLFSASVEGLPAVAGLEFSGAIEDVRIRPQLLLEGKFPVISIGAFGVSVSGDLFGGSINGALVGGILNLVEDTSATEGYRIWEASEGTPPDDAERVLFVGIQGGFSMAGIGGLTLRVGLSELGPLGALVSVEVPGGILLEPNTGLTINNFTAGVEFFKTLPSIDDPLRLRDNEFQIPTAVEASEWLADLKSQVFHQFVQVKDNPSTNGFAAAFTSPMLIMGSAKIYSMYTSQQVFNGEVQLFLDTSGKFLIRGLLNFAGDNLSISGALYADFSNVSDGSVVVLFLADVPDQIRLLTIDGALRLGFRNDAGNQVEIPVADVEATAANPDISAELVVPGGGADVDVAVLKEDAVDYVDLVIEPGSMLKLDYESIFDDPDVKVTGTLTPADGSTPIDLTFDPVPMGVEIQVANGVATEHLYASASELSSRNIRRFRFSVGGGPVDWQPGVLEITLVGGSVAQSDGTTNAAISRSMVITGATAALADPQTGINIVALNERHYLDVTYRPSGLNDAVLDTDPANLPTAPVLEGAVGSATIRGPPILQGTSADGSITVRYAFDGQFALGAVSVIFADHAFEDDQGAANVAQTLHFTVT